MFASSNLMALKLSSPTGTGYVVRVGELQVNLAEEYRVVEMVEARTELLNVFQLPEHSYEEGHRIVYELVANTKSLKLPFDVDQFIAD